MEKKLATKKISPLDLVKIISERAKKQNPEEKAKFPKEAVLYSYRPETSYTCSECAFAKNNSTKCALYGPGETIKGIGSCGLWLHMDPDNPISKEIPYLGLITKMESGYTENKNGFTCGRCEYFQVGKNSCKKVRSDAEGDNPGEISVRGCCNRWEKDKERGDMTDEQLNKLLSKE